MGRYWKLMGSYEGEAATYEAVAGAFAPSPYQPDEDAQLVGIKVIVGGEAATSLVNNEQIRLSCALWKPNTMHVCAGGNGLRTAPANAPPVYDFPVSQPVKAGVPITLEGRHGTGSPVTNNTLIMGLFES